MTLRQSPTDSSNTSARTRTDHVSSITAKTGECNHAWSSDESYKCTCTLFNQVREHWCREQSAVLCVWHVWRPAVDSRQRRPDERSSVLHGNPGCGQPDEHHQQQHRRRPSTWHNGKTSQCKPLPRFNLLVSLIIGALVFLLLLLVLILLCWWFCCRRWCARCCPCKCCRQQWVILHYMSLFFQILHTVHILSNRPLQFTFWTLNNILFRPTPTVGHLPWVLPPPHMHIHHTLNFLKKNFDFAIPRAIPARINGCKINNFVLHQALHLCVEKLSIKL